LRYPRFLLLSGELIWATQVTVHGHFWASLAGPFVIVGIGTAFAFIPVSIAALAGVAEHEAGLASGLLNTSQQPGRPQLASDEASAR
jgi:hypothetical protein